MNTGQINECLREVRGFQGTFPCNMIRPARRRPAFYVINTARVDKNSKCDKQGVVKGKHWVVVVCKSNGKGMYFDSFGMPPSQPEITRFINEMNPKGYKFSSQMIQSPLSAVCGTYCIDFVRFVASGGSMKKYLSLFKTDLNLNDRRVVHRVTCQSSAQLRLSLSNLKTLLT